ncbi:hypothetical protein [Pseudomonas sp. Gutcm_11s]|uniref:hypothetical protein n=1 Tax=Pseudomonas sp. Gutcm_11s TaxID=3026088 RepID=UPI0023607748|nr:hypothetical protein [Pseudomonas sp. Gutcm_11s]MDD0842326.1 hypothetical protein [Pseudomonas sp. Gutcm_11s]
MQLSTPRALFLSLLLALINGPALAGKGQISGGGVARTIECNQNIARSLELDDQLRRGSDTPPCREPQTLPRRFFLA